jgi:hypothetical protein
MHPVSHTCSIFAEGTLHTQEAPSLELSPGQRFSEAPDLTSTQSLPRIPTRLGKTLNHKEAQKQMLSVNLQLLPVSCKPPPTAAPLPPTAVIQLSITTAAMQPKFSPVLMPHLRTPKKHTGKKGLLRARAQLYFCQTVSHPHQRLRCS